MTTILLAIVVSGVAVGLTTQNAQAHDRRVVGQYRLTVGFLREPAVIDQINGLDLEIWDTAEEIPIAGADRTLQAEVRFGGKVRALPLVPVLNRAGWYSSEFIPTRPGGYVFRLFGTINGQPVDERFESGTGRFSDGVLPDALQFPEADPPAFELRKMIGDAEASAENARLLAVIGVIVGASGLALAIFNRLASSTSRRGEDPDPRKDAE